MMDSFGGPEVLDLREVAQPQAGPGQVRVRMTAAGLNPMDRIMTADDQAGSRFGLSLPCGFGTDYAGVVDQVSDGVTGFAVGDRAAVIGTASGKSFDYLRKLGAEPVTYGDGLAGRVRDLAPRGVTAATDLFGTEAAHAALEVGVPAGRISTIAAQVAGVTAVSGASAARAPSNASRNWPRPAG